VLFMALGHLVISMISHRFKSVPVREELVWIEINFRMSFNESSKF